jgi:hypothetical protein
VKHEYEHDGTKEVIEYEPPTLPQRIKMRSRESQAWIRFFAEREFGRLYWDARDQTTGAVSEEDLKTIFENTSEDEQDEFRVLADCNGIEAIAAGVSGFTGPTDLTGEGLKAWLVDHRFAQLRAIRDKVFNDGSNEESPA